MRLLLLFAVLSFGLSCRKVHDPQFTADEIMQGNPVRGRQLIEYYGCVSCHTIPGVRGAEGLVGPPLEKIALRTYLAGRITNTPEHMIAWLRNPEQIDPQTAMPNMHITPQDAQDIARFLYTLR